MKKSAYNVNGIQKKFLPLWRCFEIYCLLRYGVCLS